MIGKTAAIAVVAIVAATAVASAQDHPAAPTVSVMGQAEDQARPDFAMITLNVVDEQPTANEAAAENARVASAVVDGLKGSGVDAKDILTVGLSLAPVMTDVRDVKTNQFIKSVVTSYRASNAIRARLRDLDRAGALIAASVQNGALYQGVSFDVSDREAREDALRIKAAANAMHRAALYAEGAGMKLATLRSISADSGIQPRFEPGPRAMAAAAAAAPPALVVEPGLITLSETVSATWDLTTP